MFFLSNILWTRFAWNTGIWKGSIIYFLQISGNFVLLQHINYPLMAEQKVLFKFWRQHWNKLTLQGHCTCKAVTVLTMPYRNTPHSTTGESPAILLMGRRLRTSLDQLTPSVQVQLEWKQQGVVDRTSDRHWRNLQVEDQVMVRNYSAGEKWMKGIVTHLLGSRHYIVTIQHQLWKIHIDQLIRYKMNKQSWRLTSLPMNHPAEIKSQSVSGHPALDKYEPTEF